MAVLAHVRVIDDVVDYTIACSLVGCNLVNQSQSLSQPDKNALVTRCVNEQVRSVHGRDRHYIAIRSGEGHSSRNAAIKRDYLAGEHLNLLERRYGVKRSRLWEIIKS